jgi:hypothetical protein
MKELIGQIPGLTAILASFSLFLSIAHEWAYFATIGPQFRTLMGTNDYIAAGIEWLPTAIIGLVVGAAVHLFFFRVERGQSEEELVARSPNPGFMRRFRRSADFLPIVFATIVALNLFFIRPPDSIEFEATLFAAIWMLFIEYVLLHPVTLARWGGAVVTVMGFLPLALAVVIGLGANAAYLDLNDRSNPYDIRLADQSTVSQVNILRLLDRGVIYRDATTKTTRFLAWDKVHSVAKTGEPPRPRMCKWIKCA